MNHMIISLIMNNIFKISLTISLYIVMAHYVYVEVKIGKAGTILWSRTEQNFPQFNHVDISSCKLK